MSTQLCSSMNNIFILPLPFDLICLRSPARNNDLRGGISLTVIGIFELSSIVLCFKKQKNKKQKKAKIKPVDQSINFVNGN